MVASLSGNRVSLIHSVEIYIRLVHISKRLLVSGHRSYSFHYQYRRQYVAVFKKVDCEFFLGVLVIVSRGYLLSPSSIEISPFREKGVGDLHSPELKEDFFLILICNCPAKLLELLDGPELLQKLSQFISSVVTVTMSSV